MVLNIEKKRSKNSRLYYLIGRCSLDLCVRFANVQREIKVYTESRDLLMTNECQN